MHYSILIATLTACAQGSVLRPRASGASAVSQSEWNSLNSSVGGRLLAVRPPAAPCYLDYDGTTNNETSLSQCGTIEQQIDNATWIASQAGAYQNSNWATCQATAADCSLNGTLNGTMPVGPVSLEAGNCQQGSVAPMAIAVASASDVQHGLAFAKSHQVPIIIKNSGHDYKGRSSAPNSLSLWMSNYRPAMSFDENFTPDACSPSGVNTVTFGTGYGFQEVLEFAHQHGSVVVSGSSQTVRPGGGWIAGGGHSPLSPVYGLGVDNAQQFKVVLPNGTYITANKCQNEDIFFALRGGGGSTFGVIMEFSMTAHPEVPIQGAEYKITSQNQTAYQGLIKILVENALKWSSEGFGGYGLPAIDSPSSSSVTLLTPKLSLEEAKASLKPLTDFVNDNKTGNSATGSIATYASYYDFFKEVLAVSEEASANQALALASRLVPSTNFEPANQKELISALTGIAKSGQAVEPLYILITAPNTAFTGIGPNNDTSAVTPAWREGSWHVIGGRSMSNEADAATIENTFKLAHDGMNRLRQITPGSGAYQNEADTFEPDYTNSFWGEANYKRLLSIKKQIDPTNLLSCHQCVGFETSDPRFSCYPAAPS